MGDGLMATASSVKLFLLVYLQGPNTNSSSFHYFFIRVTGRRRFCFIRKGGASKLCCSWMPWCHGGWRRAWPRRCGWCSSAGSPPASPSPATSHGRSEAAISPSKIHFRHRRLRRTDDSAWRSVWRGGTEDCRVTSPWTEFIHRRTGLI